MDKPRILTAEEAAICRRNGVCPEGVAVIHSTEDSLVLLVHKTRDTIHIHAGERRWKKRKEVT